MSQAFIKLNNNFFTDDTLNIFAEVGTEGFLLYSYILYEQGNNTSTTITIKNIQTFMNRETDKSQTITYDNKKTCKIGILKDKRTISNYIDKLVERNYITLHNKNDIVKMSLNTPLLVSINETNFDNGFTIMPNMLFLNYIHKLGHIGWSLLCLLSKLHNIEYGGTTSEGFANPSEEYLSKILKIGITSVKAYLKLLEKNKLIKIEVQKPILKGIDKHNNELYEYIPNHYTVRWKVNGDKNYFTLPSKNNTK